MPSNDFTFCNNPRCGIKCRRKQYPKDLKYVCMATFGPDNGDRVKESKHCNMHWEVDNG
ncbi:MAG: hypothetical protein GY861_13860 [bacterium]|nr:hypothetical protein [bacterium]